MAETTRSAFGMFDRLARVGRVGSRLTILTFIVAAAIVGTRTRAQLGAVQTGLPNFDVRSEKTAEASAYLTRFTAPASLAEVAQARTTAVAQLQADIPAVDLDVNPEMGTIEIVGRKPGAGYLTFPSTDRVGTMRAFMTAYAGVYGLTPDQVANLVLVADYMNPAGNMGWVEFEQRLNDIPVFQGLIRGGFTSQGELVRTTGPLAAGLDAAFLPAFPLLTAAQAVSRGAASVGWSVPERSLVETANEGGRKITFARGSLAHDTKAWQVYFPLSPGIARLAWAMEIWSDLDVFLLVLDAEDGTVLFRKNLTNYQTQSATYVVYNDDSPAPMSPSTTTPGMGLQAPMINRTLFTLIGNEGNLSFNNLGWMTDGTNLTDGNNVEAGIDRDGVDGVDAPVVGVARVFDFLYNPNPGNPPPGDDPLTPAFQMGEVTHGFYWTNRFHDAAYLLGFTEAARNFQNDNFGRGGLAGDRISAEFQDSSGVNNANFTAPADGTRGRMQMYIFPGPTPDRTSGLDLDVLIHELTHGLSTRLHNNSSGLLTVMSAGMGEGWSDFYARALLSSAGEDPNGVYTTGGWVTYLLTGGYVDNYYYGIRRFPYAVMSNLGANGRPHNPLTFADIDPAQIDLTDGAFPRGPFGSATPFQVHNVGEVWASALNEVRARMIARKGWPVANQRLLQIVTDGMKLNPVNPTFLQARDAIIAAAAALPANLQADVDDVWAGFALRGIGYSAQVLNAGTGSVVEAFDVPGIDANGGTLVGESIPNGRMDAGETLTVSLCVTNVAVTTSGTVNGRLLATGGVQSPSGPQSYGMVVPGGNVCRNFTFVVAASCGATLTATLQAQETGGLTRPLRYTFPVGSETPILSEGFDGVVAPALPAGWSTSTLSGTPNLWATNTTTPHTAPNRAFTGDPATVSDNVLVSPAIMVPAGGAVLSFRNHYVTEAGFDGGVLEISINGGAFADIVGAGGSFVSGGYNATLSTAFGNPLPGRPAWSGDSGGYITTVVNLPAAAAGQSAVLRWRMGSDSSVASTGWAIDSVALFFYTCSSQAPVITAHPQSQTVMSGSNATLFVYAAGSAPLGYQWYQGASGDTSTPIGGATSSTYITPALVALTSYWVRVTNAFGVANSNTAVMLIGPPAGSNIVQNGDFSTPVAPTGWSVFEEPDIVYNVTAGVFQFYRANPTTTPSGQATIFQATGVPIATRTPLQATFDIGNSSTVRKRISVLLIDSDFSDITVCTFWLAPGAPLATYTMRTHTTKNWNSAAIYFYAATRGQDGGFYQLDNVTLAYTPGLSTSRTDCVDPTTPAPPGGSAGPNLLSNSDFGLGALSPWTTFGVLTSQVAGGVFEFIRPSPPPATPAGTVFQATGQAMTANQFLTATFQLGNSSAVRKRVTVLLVSDPAFSDLMACTFWLAPGQPLRPYAIQGRATIAWTNATLYVYAATVGNDTWTRLDNVTLARTPGTPMLGTECVEPVMPVAGSWSLAPPYPITIMDQAVVTLGGNLYVFGGASTFTTAVSNRFDGAAWSPIAPLPAPLGYAAAVTDGTDIFILGGVVGTPQNTLYRYNVGSNNYTTLAPFTTATWNHAAVYLNGKIYKFGGTGPASASTNALEIYDVLGNSWSPGANYPLAASVISAWAQGNYIYAAGGLQTTGGPTLKTYRYDPMANAWDDAAMADLPATRWGAASAFHDGRAVLAGGLVAGSALANTSRSSVAWDAAGNAWVAGPDMIGERFRMNGAALNGNFYVIGGRSILSPPFAGTDTNQRLGSGSPFVESGAAGRVRTAGPAGPVAGSIDLGLEAPPPPPGASTPPQGMSVITPEVGTPDWSGTRGFRLTPDGDLATGAGLGWRADALQTGREVLYWERPIDLTTAATASLSFDSWLSPGASTGAVQVTDDGITWRTVAVVPKQPGRTTVDLTAFAGRVVYVRFVFDAVAPPPGLRPETWTIDNVSVTIRGPASGTRPR